MSETTTPATTDRAAAARDSVAQWAFDTHTILDRFHLWLEDVEVKRTTADDAELESFVGARLERAFVMAAAVTALGTKVFGPFGGAKGLDKDGTNRVKKDADALSSYALSEGLWFLSRNLPENHAVMVSLGEGLMPKVGETPEQGANPLLGFGRVYARPLVAKFLDRRVHRMINDPSYGWEGFWSEINEAGITIWGAAIDTLEGTSLFAQGKNAGSLTVLHLFDQPLQVNCPYEGYVGQLILPRAVVRNAADRSVLLSYRSPRKLVLEAIRETYPDIAPERVHVWTLGGEKREGRLGDLWREWRDLGVHVVEDGWKIPNDRRPDGEEVVVDSCTYAPTFRIGTYEDGGERHLFICDGYAASAEAIQGASLDTVLDTRTLLCLFSSVYKAPHHAEAGVMQLDPESDDFAEQLRAKIGDELAEKYLDAYRTSIREARDAGMPLSEPMLTVEDFLPRKAWRMLAVGGFMTDDPYRGSQGVEELGDGVYRVTVRAASRQRIEEAVLTLRLRESFEASRLVFSPLLDRFCAGEDFRARAVKISDSGRIRNELQTLCPGALEFFSDDKIEDGIRVNFSDISEALMSPEKKARIREVLTWYKEGHPAWFGWLDLVD